MPGDGKQPIFDKIGLKISFTKSQRGQKINSEILNARVKEKSTITDKNIVCKTTEGSEILNARVDA